MEGEHLPGGDLLGALQEVELPIEVGVGLAHPLHQTPHRLGVALAQETLASLHTLRICRCRRGWNSGRAAPWSRSRSSHLSAKVGDSDGLVVAVRFGLPPPRQRSPHWSRTPRGPIRRGSPPGPSPPRRRERSPRRSRRPRAAHRDHQRGSSAWRRSMAPGLRRGRHCAPGARWVGAHEAGGGPHRHIPGERHGPGLFIHPQDRAHQGERSPWPGRRMERGKRSAEPGRSAGEFPQVLLVEVQRGLPIQLHEDVPLGAGDETVRAEVVPPTRHPHTHVQRRSIEAHGADGAHLGLSVPPGTQEEARRAPSPASPPERHPIGEAPGQPRAPAPCRLTLTPWERMKTAASPGPASWAASRSPAPPESSAPETVLQAPRTSVLSKRKGDGPGRWVLS